MRLAAAARRTGELCPLCDGTLRADGDFEVDGNRYVPCPACHAHVATPAPDQRDLEAFYRGEYYGVFGAAEAGPRRQAMLRRLLSRIPRRPPGRLLDVGCGAGHLMALARAAGWEVVGVEPSRQACAAARARYGLEPLAAPLEEADLPQASFDVVTLVNVLDQAPDPVRLLAEARRVLGPEGLLVIRVPNGDFHRAAWAAIRRCPAGAAWRLRPLVIFHPLCLNARALRALLARAGLGRIRVGNAPVSGSEWSVAPGAAGRAALACLAALARAGAAAAAGLSGGQVLCAPSLLATAHREGP